jgi:hypothetical protein
LDYEFRVMSYALKKGMPEMSFQVSWLLFCGSGFPAATIEAESLSHKKLTDRYTSAVAGRGAKMPA